jgi:hypothetical protein
MIQPEEATQMRDIRDAPREVQDSFLASQRATALRHGQMPISLAAAIKHSNKLANALRSKFRVV